MNIQELITQVENILKTSLKVCDKELSPVTHTLRKTWGISGT